MLTFSIIGEKLIFGFRNHEKIWVSGKLGYEGPRDFKIGANCAEWPCLFCSILCKFSLVFLQITRKVSILGYILIHTLYINMAILHNLRSFKNL